MIMSSKYELMSFLIFWESVRLVQLQSTFCIAISYHFYRAVFCCFRYAELRVKKKERDAQKLPALVMDRLGKLLYRGPSGSERKQYVYPVVKS